MPTQRAIELEELQTYFRLPEKEVAKRLGICLTSLKKVCRSNGIYRWPYRKMMSLDKKMCKDGLDSPAAVASPRGHECTSPTEMSNASTACSPEPETAKAAANPPAATALAPHDADAPAAGTEDVKISLTLSPEMEEIGSGGEIRFTLQHDAGLVPHVEWQPETPATTAAAHAADKCHWRAVSPAQHAQGPTAATAASADLEAEQDADLAADLAGMSNEELIAQLAGCAAVPARASMAACMDHEEPTQADGALETENLEAFDTGMCHEEAMHTLMFETPDDDERDRLWGQDLLGLC